MFSYVYSSQKITVRKFYYKVDVSGTKLGQWAILQPSLSSHASTSNSTIDSVFPESVNLKLIFYCIRFRLHLREYFRLPLLIIRRRPSVRYKRSSFTPCSIFELMSFSVDPLEFLLYSKGTSPFHNSLSRHLNCKDMDSAADLSVSASC